MLRTAVRLPSHRPVRKRDFPPASGRNTKQGLPNGNHDRRAAITHLRNLIERPGSGTRIDRRAIPGHAAEGIWRAPDGHAIRRIDWPAAQHAPPRGSLLFLPGRGDAYEKYLETLDHWQGLGWHVTALDWRGQAGSGRLAADPGVGHVSDFGVWIDDLAAFWWEWKALHRGPHVVVAHSMGGHLALRALAEKRIDPAAMVLSAPMLGFTTPGPDWLMGRVAKAMLKLGDPQRRAWKISEKPGTGLGARQTLLTHDPVRYQDEMAWREARPELLLGPGSWQWVERAYASFAVLAQPGLLEAVETPILLLATRADKLVSWRAIERAARRLPRGQFVLYGKEAAHELLRETDLVRDRVLRNTDDFLDRLAPAVLPPASLAPAIAP